MWQSLFRHQFTLKMSLGLIPRILRNDCVRNFSCLLKKPQCISSIQQLTNTSLTKDGIFGMNLSPLLTQTCGFKVKGRLRRRCKDCYFVMKDERLLVLCKTHPRHKQMAMQKKPKNTWILTHATQSKVRPF
jgi:large subunit ribosomal protein L36